MDAGKRAGSILPVVDGRWMWRELVCESHESHSDMAAAQAMDDGCCQKQKRDATKVDDEMWW